MLRLQCSVCPKALGSISRGVQFVTFFPSLLFSLPLHSSMGLCGPTLVLAAVSAAGRAETSGRTWSIASEGVAATVSDLCGLTAIGSGIQLAHLTFFCVV